MSFEIATGYNRKYTSLPSELETVVGSAVGYPEVLIHGGSRIWKVDPTTDTFSQQSSTAIDAYTLGFNPYFISRSGHGWLYACGDGPSSNSYRTQYIGAYDATTKTWYSKALPTEVRPFTIASNVNGSIVIVGATTSTNSVVFYRSTNYGETWTDITSSLGVGINTIYAGEASNGFLLYFGDDTVNTTSGFMYLSYNVSSIGNWRSTDGGVTWTTRARSSAVTSIAGSVYDLGNQGGHAIYFEIGSVRWIIASTQTGVRWSKDYGITWKEVNFSGQYPSSPQYSTDIRGIATDGVYLMVCSYGIMGEAAIWSVPLANIDTFSKWVRQTYSSIQPNLWSMGVARNPITGYWNFYVADVGGSVRKLGYSYDSVNSTVSINSVSAVISGKSDTYGAKMLSDYQYLVQNVNAWGNKHVDLGGSYLSDVPSSRKFNKVNLSSGGWNNTSLAPSYDDTYNSDAIPIGWTWGWGGSNYTSWRFNTNGQMQFSNYSGGISPTSSTYGICAHYGDLWFGSNGDIVNTRGSQQTSTEILNTPTQVTLANLTSYGISASNYSTGVVKITAYSQATTFNGPRYVEVTGYISGGVTYTYANSYVMKLIPYSGQEYYIPTGGVNADSLIIGTSRTQVIPEGTYGAGVKPAIWHMSTNWIDSGVAHYQYDVVVYQTRYGNNNLHSGYRITLYKAGSQQKFTVRLLETTMTYRGDGFVGPWPMIASDSTLASANTFLDKTWYSNDNGTTWTFSNRNTTGDSTVVQMGTPVTVASTAGGISARTLLEQLHPRRVTRFGSTTAAITRPTTIKMGLGLINSMMRFVNQAQPINDEESSFWSFVLTSSYGIADIKTTSYYSYADVTASGYVGPFTIMELYRLYYDGVTLDSDTPAGVSRILGELTSGATWGGVDVMEIALRNNWIEYSYSTMSQLWSQSLPGVATVPVSKANIAMSSFNGVGPVDNNPGRYIPNSYKYNYNITYGSAYYADLENATDAREYCPYQQYPKPY